MPLASSRTWRASKPSAVADRNPDLTRSQEDVAALCNNAAIGVTLTTDDDLYEVVFSQFSTSAHLRG